CVIELLYFVVYGHRLYLHSFPTRRSSDLGEQPVDRGNRPARVLEMRTHGRCTRRPGGGGGVGGACAVSGGIRVESCRICVGSGGDRKSTRLNSSHVKISYAVFCLKKKNTQ